MSLPDRSLTFDDVQIIPGYSEVSTRQDCNPSTAVHANSLYPNDYGPLSFASPIMVAPMDSLGSVKLAKAVHKAGATNAFHRFDNETIFEKLKEFAELTNCNHPVIASIGAKANDVQFAGKLIEAGANTILIDVAHGHHKMVKDTIAGLKQEYPTVPVIAGNVCTKQGAEDLIKWGADALRVGVGNGSVCSTRINTGVGVPQFSAIMSIASVCEENHKILIADGGIKNPGDAAKALAAGAHVVMIGSAFAGCLEADGDRITTLNNDGSEVQWIEYRGSASFASKQNRGDSTKFVEGVSTRVRATNESASDIIDRYMDGIRSAMSYVGANTLEEFHRNSDFVIITSAGRIEASPHMLHRV